MWGVYNATVISFLNLHSDIVGYIFKNLRYRISSYRFLIPVRKLFKFLLNIGKVNAETIWNFQGFTIPKKNSCRGIYMRKYGIWILKSYSVPLNQIMERADKYFSNFFSMTWTLQSVTGFKVKVHFDNYTGQLKNFGSNTKPEI